jgi:hypothetical protein
MSRIVRATSSVLALVSLVAAVSLGGGGLAAVGVSSAQAANQPVTISAIPGGYAVTFSGDDASYSFEVSTDGLSAVGTGAGWIVAVSGGPTGRATFGFVAGIAPDGTVRGHLVYIDHGIGLRVQSTTITSVARVGCTFTFTGVGDSTAGPALFEVIAADNGEPGTSTDALFIQVVPPGYAAAGVLGGGNIQAHERTCP